MIASIPAEALSLRLAASFGSLYRNMLVFPSMITQPIGWRRTYQWSHGSEETDIAINEVNIVTWQIKPFDAKTISRA